MKTSPRLGRKAWIDLIHFWSTELCDFKYTKVSKYLDSEESIALSIYLYSFICIVEFALYFCYNSDIYID